MQFDQAGTIIRRIRYYFAPSGADVFDGPHYFVSDNYNRSGRIFLGPGERWDAVRTYTKGFPGAPFSGTGSFCGPADWWQNGAPSDAPDLMPGEFGIPVCCALPVPGQVGIQVGIQPGVPLCQPFSIAPADWSSREAKVAGQIGSTIPGSNDALHYIDAQLTQATGVLRVDVTGFFVACSTFPESVSTYTVTVLSGTGWNSSHFTLVLTGYNAATLTGTYVPPPGVVYSPNPAITFTFHSKP